MTSKEDLGVICNYQESATPIIPGSKIFYIDYTDNDEEYKRELKVKNRGLAIDAVLEDKTEEYNNREKIDADISEPYGSGSMLSSSVSGMQTMSVKVNSLPLGNPSKFKSYDDLWNLVMDHIDANTQNPHPFMVNTYAANSMGVNKTPNFTYTKDTTKTDSENYEIMCRKILTRIMMASNALASALTRRGPATTIIVGKHIARYLESFYTTNKPITNKNILGHITGMTVVLSDRISPNKMIISRAESKQDGGGLMLLNDMNNYYLTETRRTFYKNFIWFDVIV